MRNFLARCYHSCTGHLRLHTLPMIRNDWKKLNMNEEHLKLIKKQLQDMIQTPSLHPHYVLSTEKPLIHYIKQQTSLHNKNNVTRTAAYLSFFLKHPVIHWSFLAHMVSRNGGWNMTDLKSSLLDRLLNDDDKKNYFMFLEKANACIFNDAYPQLLLYEASIKKRRSMFHLLPSFSVSKFIRPFWELFLRTQDSTLLTVALIVNEQHHLEQVVMSDPFYRKNVIYTWQYQLNEWLQLNHVVFPYLWKNNRIRLAGQKITHFTRVDERVEAGKRLYCILFGINKIYRHSLQYASLYPHTGSRQDYWKQVYTTNCKRASRATHNNCLKNIEPYVFSPTLKEAWNEVSHSFPAHTDWFKQMDVLDLFATITTPTDYDKTTEHCQFTNNMNKLQNAKRLLRSVKRTSNYSDNSSSVFSKLGANVRKK